MSNAFRTTLLAPLFVTAAVIALSGAAQAQRASKIVGEVLVGLCSGSDAKGLEACEAYIDGVLDAAVTYQQLRPLNGANGVKGGTLPAYLCIPGEMTGIQLRKTFLDAYNANPQPRRFGAGIVLSAFSKAYPCAGGSSVKQ